MEELVTWVWAHKVELVGIWMALVTAASIIVKLTPSKADDSVLAKILAFTGKYLALNPADKPTKPR